jgi:hypothetical protein
MPEAAMSDVKSVAVSVRSPNPADPNDAGRAAIGFYVLEDDVLTMTDGEGKPVRRRYSSDVCRHSWNRTTILW